MHKKTTNILSLCSNNVSIVHRKQLKSNSVLYVITNKEYFSVNGRYLQDMMVPALQLGKADK